MASEQSRAAPSAATPFPGLTPAEAAKWPGATLNDVANASQAYMSGIAAVNQEIASFLQTRLQHDIALGESLARCRTLADASKAQSDWLRQAHDDYSAESQKLFELGSRLMSGSWMPAADAAQGAKVDASGRAGPATK